MPKQKPPAKSKPTRYPKGTSRAELCAKIREAVSMPVKLKTREDSFSRAELLHLHSWLHLANQIGGAK